jgi:hypothetical protein
MGKRLHAGVAAPTASFRAYGVKQMTKTERSWSMTGAVEYCVISDGLSNVESTTDCSPPKTSINNEPQH